MTFWSQKIEKVYQQVFAKQEQLLGATVEA